MIAAPRARALEDFGLGVGDRLHAAQILDVRQGDGGHQGDMRANQRDKRAFRLDRSTPSRALLEIGVARHPRETQWHADAVIVAFDGACTRPETAGKRGGEGFLGAGLADRSLWSPSYLGRSIRARDATA